MEMHPKSEAEEKSSPNWLELPQEVTVSILQKLDVADILESVQKVCTQWESICKEPLLWRTIICRYDQSSLGLYCMLRQAVDRSCGGLVDLDLHLGKSCSDKFLNYVTQRCTKIRRLRLVRGSISSVALREAAKRLPLLEDLELSYCNVTAEDLHKIGECCPLLKSLSIIRVARPETLMDDSEAMAIAENMVELRNLQLFRNQLTNKGLKAILDSCSHLEFLDLRQCFNLDLEDSSLGKRCTERIKKFWGPFDSFGGCYYEFNAALCDSLANACDSDDTDYDVYTAFYGSDDTDNEIDSDFGHILFIG